MNFDTSIPQNFRNDQWEEAPQVFYPRGFGLVVRPQFVMCGLGARHWFVPCRRQKLGI